MSPKEITKLDITEDVFKEPIEVIKNLSANLDIKFTKVIIKITTESKSKCSVCGKDIEIFDHVISCPLCSAKAHKNHLLDWIKMKHACPVCKKSLNVSSSGKILVE
ncbi:MAG: hypothetical protein P8Y70_17025 [Candidatus Lokiarchaeota archaeon]